MGRCAECNGQQRRGGSLQEAAPPPRPGGAAAAAALPRRGTANLQATCSTSMAEEPQLPGFPPGPDFHLQELERPILLACLAAGIAENPSAPQAASTCAATLAAQNSRKQRRRRRHPGATARRLFDMIAVCCAPPMPSSVNADGPANSLPKWWNTSSGPCSSCASTPCLRPRAPPSPAEAVGPRLLKMATTTTAMPRPQLIATLRARTAEPVSGPASKQRRAAQRQPRGPTERRMHPGPRSARTRAPAHRAGWFSTVQ